MRQAQVVGALPELAAGAAGATVAGGATAGEWVVVPTVTRPITNEAASNTTMASATNTTLRG